MGCDIHAHVEIRAADGTWHYGGDDLFPDNEYVSKRHCPFGGTRSYRLFGFLADVRNYSHSPVISPPRGLPHDVSAAVRAKHRSNFHNPGYFHSTSWLTLAELRAFDYEQTFTDQRTRKPETTTMREFLGEGYFARLNRLSRLGGPDDVRIVFWFDN